MYFSTALIIVGTAVVGFVFASNSLSIKYRLHLSDGYSTFLLSVGASLLPLSLSLLVSYACKDSELIAEFVINQSNRVFSIQPPLEATKISLLFAQALLIAYLWPAIWRTFFKLVFSLDHDTLKSAAMYKVEPSPVMLNIIFASLRTGLPIAVTMSDRKVYVGYPATVSSSLFSSHGGELLITPMVSGYRDAGDLSLNLTTPYEDVLTELLEAKSAADNKNRSDREIFLITLPIREVVHAHLYDPQLQPVFDRHAARAVGSQEDQWDN